MVKTARDLQVGDVVRLDNGDRRKKWTVDNIHTDGDGVVYVGLKRNKWWFKETYFMEVLESVHRPQPDGTLKQVFPGAE